MCFRGVLGFRVQGFWLEGLVLEGSRVYPFVVVQGFGGFRVLAADFG